MNKVVLCFCGVLSSGFAIAEEAQITINLLTTSGLGVEVGTVTVVDTNYGAVFTPDLRQLTPGLHGFHVHQNPDCGPAENDGKTVPGLAAGGHYDPGQTGTHLGPYAEGHLGDLPALNIDAAGQTSYPMLAPRIKVADLKGRSLMIHANGDNYSDEPKKLGGGGARIACGVVK